MTRHISEDLLFRMAAEPVTDAGQRQVRLAQLARTLHKLYETTEQDIELFYYYLMKIIFKGIAEPEMTVGEIIECI